MLIFRHALRAHNVELEAAMGACPFINVDFGDADEETAQAYSQLMTPCSIFALCTANFSKSVSHAIEPMEDTEERTQR